MNSKIAHLLMAAALVLPGAALAQAQSSTPDPGATSAPAPSNKIGTINVEAAIYSSNEGMRDFEALNKTEEPKQTELKSKNDELEALKKQLNTQGDKLNESARANLVSDFRAVEFKPIDFTLDGLARSVAIPGILSFEIEGVASRAPRLDKGP